MCSQMNRPNWNQPKKKHTEGVFGRYVNDNWEQLPLVIQQQLMGKEIAPDRPKKLICGFLWVGTNPLEQFEMAITFRGRWLGVRLHWVRSWLKLPGYWHWGCFRAWKVNIIRGDKAGVFK